MAKTIYIFRLYKKIKRASFSSDQRDYSLLMVSFNVGTEIESIILQKISPGSKKHDISHSISCGKSDYVFDGIRKFS